jgi:hypothetical protein
VNRAYYTFWQWHTARLCCTRIAWGIALPVYIALGDRRGMDIWRPVGASWLRDRLWLLALEVLAR